MASKRKNKKTSRSLARRERQLQRKEREAENVERAIGDPGISWAVSTGLISDQAFAAGEPIYRRRSFYETHSTVHSAISAKATNISQVPLVIEEGPVNRAKVIDDTSENDRGKLFDVLDQPNEFMVQSQLIEGTVINLDQDGMAFWVLDRRNVEEIPSRIAIWRRRHFLPVIAEDGKKLLGWFFVPPNNGEHIPLMNSQVVVFRYFDPDNPFLGMSPLQAAIRGINFDSLAGVYSEAFFVNNGDPGGVIESPKPMRAKQADEIRQQWNSRHQGPQNAHKVAVLWGGAAYKQIAVSNRDLQLMDQRRFTRDDVLGVLKVPKSEISIYEDLTHANAVSQNRSFWEKTLIPIIRLINSTIKVQLTVGIKGGLGVRQFRIFLDIRSVVALQPQLTDIVSNAEKLWKIGYPINAINEKLQLGMPELPWGDDGYANSSLATFEDIKSGKARKPAKPSNPSPPEPSGEPGEPGEDMDDPPSLEPDDSNTDRALDRFKKLVSRAAMTHTNLAEVNPVTIKPSLWRMRASQLKSLENLEENYSSGIISKELWEKKLKTRFRKEDDKAVEILVEFIFSKLLNILETADERKGTNEMVKTDVTSFFNKLSRKKVLESISKLVSVRREPCSTS
jgi:HK97 family phage portal protein